ncbi:MAG: cytochrome C [Thiobacillus sp.]|nr:cytochrome C [Thiobacillus sp.]
MSLVLSKNVHALWKGLIAVSFIAGLSTPAHALPSFARQTGEECTACHVGGYGPQLTLHGMKFKLGGYTDSTAASPLIPLSAMLVASASNLKTKPEDGPKTDRSIQEASVFLAGRLTSNIGSFIQATTSSADHGRVSLDNVDVRAAKAIDLKGQDAIVGVSFNNNPTVTDPLNTVPAWRFPYMTSELTGPGSSPLLDGGLEMQVGGITAYAFVNDSIYVELGGYSSLPDSFLNTVNVDVPDPKLNGVAPYWRLAYIKDNHKDAYSIGLVGMNASLRPTDGTGSDKYDDIGVDASYQFLGTRKHIFTANSSYIHERQTLGATDSGNKYNLDRFDIAGSYYYDQTYGLNAGLFRINGNASDADSNGYILQADWTPFGKEGSWGAPWANVRVGLQYTGYSKFDGSSANASDNNTTYAFIWTAF